MVSRRRMIMWMALKPVLKTLGTVFVVSGTLGILQYLLGDGAVAQRMGK